MKTLFLSFIALSVAVIVHATPTIPNGRVESLQAGGNSLDKRADQKCVQCDPDADRKPRCLECPDTLFGGCLNTHGGGCGLYNSLPVEDIGCKRGSWACVVNCCNE